VSHRALLPVVLGGLFYSLGAVLNSLRWPTLWPGVFGVHDLFHLFVMADSLTHYWFILKQIFDSCAAVFDVSPLAMDRGSRPGRWHSATFHAFLSGLPH
jgi:Haemolysin-III related